MSDTNLPICVAALYHFTRFADPQAIQPALAALCQEHGVKGTLILANEGVNGTIAGSDTAIAAVLAHLRTLPGCVDLEAKFSRAAQMPFYRMKVRVKSEIVTMGQPHIDPLTTGHYVSPHDWNVLISDPGTIVIDTRNDYEVSVGTFAGAIDPNTEAFSDFPAWFRAERDRLLGQGNAPPKVAMFCTGGIRCEKSTAFLKAEGVDEVYHLKGGILKYLEEVPKEESLWQGECFVFDQRVTVKHGLEQGSYGLCYACRLPLLEADKASPLYEAGVSCHQCHGSKSDEQRARYRERQRQGRLAAQQGRAHLGADQSQMVSMAEDRIKPSDREQSVAISDKANGSSSHPILYSFRRCPYAMRARLALLASGLVCELREVKLSAKPVQMLAASPKGTVPVMVLPDGSVIEESLDIMRWALARQDPQGWLQHDDGELIAVNDGAFKRALDRYKYPDRHGADALENRAAGLDHLHQLEERLSVQANLCGDAYGIVDAALFPFVRQFAEVDRVWFDALPLPNLHQWLARQINSAQFAAVMHRLNPWKFGDAPVVFPAN